MYKPAVVFHRNNFLQVNVHFESMVTKHREQILRYTQEDLLGKSNYRTQSSLIERCACLCNASCVNLLLHVVFIHLFWLT